MRLSIDELLYKQRNCITIFFIPPFPYIHIFQPIANKWKLCRPLLRWMKYLFVPKPTTYWCLIKNLSTTFNVGARPWNPIRTRENVQTKRYSFPTNVIIWRWRKLISNENCKSSHGAPANSSCKAPDCTKVRHMPYFLCHWASANVSKIQVRQRLIDFRGEWCFKNWDIMSEALMKIE